MKRTLMAVLVAFLVAGTAMAAPRGPRQKGVEGEAGPREGMMFRLVASVRTELNLTAEQNTQLDQLLNEVKEFMASERNTFRTNRESMMDQFVAEDFDAASIQASREKLREQRRDRMQSFMIQKIQALHDLLTLEQREQLKEIVKEKRSEMRGNRQDRGPRHGRF